MRRRSTHSCIDTTAGPWLRCFLGAAICLPACLPALAQVDIPGPEHLVRVEGIVVNTKGKPVANAEVTLGRDGRVAYSTRTNQAGEFRFEHASGRFVFRVGRTENAPAERDLIVGEELVTRAERKRLYVIVGPGACTDECSDVLTSKREFQKELRAKNRR